MAITRTAMKSNGDITQEITLVPDSKNKLESIKPFNFGKV